MSTETLKYINRFLPDAWQKHRVPVKFYPCCQVGEYTSRWEIVCPLMPKRGIVLLHAQDFLTCQNGNCAELEYIESQYGEQSNRVAVVHWNRELHQVYNGPIMLVYFPSHSWELLSALVKQKADWHEHLLKNRSNKVQCLNGWPKPHRRNVVQWLQDNNVKSKISLGLEQPLEQQDYSTYQDCDNVSNWKSLLWLYGNTDINVVTETQYHDYPGIISEKTLFAFLAKQVPIVIGYKNIIQHCEDMGFDMFRDVVNTSYDFESPATRWRNALECNKQLLQQGIDRAKLQKRLDANFDLVCNLPDVLQRNYYKSVSTILTKFPNLCTG